MSNQVLIPKSQQDYMNETSNSPFICSLTNAIEKKIAIYSTEYIKWLEKRYEKLTTPDTELSLSESEPGVEYVKQ